MTTSDPSFSAAISFPQGEGEALGPVFDGAPDAMLVLDPGADAIRDANPAAARLLGYDRETLRAMRVTALHPDQVPTLIVFT